MRNEWYIDPIVKAIIDKEDYLYALLPTIIWMPWRYRYPNTFIVEFHWLIFHIGFGLWKHK